MTIRMIPCSKSVVIVVSGVVLTAPSEYFQLNNKKTAGAISRNNAFIKSSGRPIYRLIKK